jgi:hypothetical protein
LTSSSATSGPSSHRSPRPSGQDLVGDRRAEQLEEPLGRRVERRGLGHGETGQHLRRQVLRVDAAQAGGDDRAELAGGADADEQLVAEARLHPIHVFDDEDAPHVRGRPVPLDEPGDLRANGLPVLPHEGDAGRLGLVHDVGRHDLEHDLIAGKARERLLGDHLLGGQEHVTRRRDRADQLHDRVDLVLEELPAAFVVDERQRPLDGVSLRTRKPILERRHLEDRRIRRLGRGQVFGVQRVDPVAHRHRVAAAAEPVEVGLTGVPAEPERPLVRLDDFRALPPEHRGDGFLEFPRVDVQEERGGAQDRDVGRAPGSGRARDAIGVDQHVPWQRSQTIEHRLDGRVVADVDEGVDAGDHGAAVLQVLHVPQALEGLDGDEQVGLAGRDEIRVQRAVGEAQM